MRSKQTFERTGATTARGRSHWFSDYASRPALENSEGHVRRTESSSLRIMKFGGTSVGDATCIAKVTDIIRAGLRESNLVVVVSAMSGVTNKLVKAAVESEKGNREAVQCIFSELREQHDAALTSLIRSETNRTPLSRQMDNLFQDCERLCEGTRLLGELTPRARDSITSLGERLSAPLLTAVLVQSGVASESIVATGLIITDSYHGGAEPSMELTRERCQARLYPLLQRGIVPVVTGFIGSNKEGVLTTLGRGGSDYSATILGAVLEAAEVIIWTDVDGLLTADPRLVPTARTIPEISFREASELAYFGARVLHPKTLRPVMDCGIPLRIQNTFKPELPGTKITPSGPITREAGVTALTAMADAALIIIGGPGLSGVQDVLGRTFATAAGVRADVLLISQSSSQNDICLVVSSAVAKRTAEALRYEFAHELSHQKAEHVTLSSTVAVVTIVGPQNCPVSGIVGRVFTALYRQGIDVIAIAYGASERNVTFAVANEHMELAVAAMHQEFQLETRSSQAPPPSTTDTTSAWPHRTQQVRADAD